jgi:Cu2+-containing amine oxidase
MHPITGLILNLIEYNDVKNETDPANYRLILYQANLSEAITVYGDSTFGTKSFNFLDCGEYTVTDFSATIQPGLDVVPYATMYNPVYLDENGDLFQWPNTLAIYEEDAGETIWTHYNFVTDIPQGRRGRNLVF